MYVKVIRHKAEGNNIIDHESTYECEAIHIDPSHKDGTVEINLESAGQQKTLVVDRKAESGASIYIVGPDGRTVDAYHY